MKAAPLFLLVAACTPAIDAYKGTDVQRARDLDVLFVIDDSTDRAKYDQMAAQVDALQTQLATIDGQLPSLHVGVVTTDLGTSAIDDRAPLRPTVMGCLGVGKAGALQTFESTVTANYLEDLRAPDGTRTKNYTGTLAEQLALLTNPDMPAQGCEFEQPMEAMRRALDRSANPGFIRDGALLAVVFLTNSDDCSLKKGALLEPLDPSLGALNTFRCTTQGVVCDLDDPTRTGAKKNCRPREDSQFIVPVSEYVDFLADYKPSRADIIVSAVAGPRTSFVVQNVGVPVLAPSCQGPGGRAVPAVRIGALVDAFGGDIVDTCTQQSTGFAQLSAPIVNRQTSCVAELTMAETDTCTVTEIDGDTETDLDRCAEGDAGPCWYAYANAGACPSGDNLAIGIRRGTTTAPADARIQARCFVQ